MSVLIIYNSRTGFTERYAAQLAQIVSGQAMPLSAAKRARFETPDVMLFGSRAHAGSIERLKAGAELLRNGGADRIGIFVTGAMPEDAKPQIDALWERNLPRAGLANVPRFYLPAGLCYERMGAVDRFLMGGLKFALRHKKEKTPEDEMLEKSIAESYDISSEKYLDPVLRWIRQVEDISRS